MDNHKDFIPGEKYALVPSAKGIKATCVGHSSNGNAVMEWPSGEFYAVSHPGRWKEIKEPREYWVVEIKGYKDWSSANPCKEVAEEYAAGLVNTKVIHVREVLDE